MFIVWINPTQPAVAQTVTVGQTEARAKTARLKTARLKTDKLKTGRLKNWRIRITMAEIVSRRFLSRLADILADVNNDGFVDFDDILSVIEIWVHS